MFQGLKVASLPLQSVIRKVAKPLVLTVVLILSGFFVANNNIVLAAHTATVTVDPTLVKGGTPSPYTFTLGNDVSSANPIYKIKITAPTGFTISDALICPTNWTPTFTSTYIECIGDADPSDPRNVPVGNHATVSFSATASGTDSTNPWVVLTTDNVFFPQINNPVTVVDATAPVITLSGATPVIVEAGSTYTDVGATASDNVDITLNIITVNPVNNLVVGTYTVIYNVLDAVGNPAAEVTRTVNVVDTTPPAITAPANQTFEATGPLTAPRLVLATAIDITDSNPVITYEPHSFAVGVHTVTWTATDVLTNHSSITSQVTITDLTAPDISAHADVTTEATSAAGAVVTYDLPTATDLVDGSRTVICTPASGIQFVLGDTTVDCSAQDSQAVPNVANSHFTAHVVDTTKPIITAPAGITQEANGVLSTVVLGTPIISDAVDANPIVTNNASGGFPVGTTVVTWTAIDASENSQTATQNVMITDTTKPAITAPIAQTFEATGLSTTPTLLVPATANDIVDTTPTITYTPQSFAVGIHTVTWKATDDSNNFSETTSQITITDTTPPAIVLHGNVTTEATSVSGATVTYNLPTAIDLVDGAVAVTCAPVSGSTFVLGDTTVDCSAQDSQAVPNVANSHFTAHVVDTTAPVILEGTLLTPNDPKIFIKGDSTYIITWNKDKIIDINLKSLPIKIEYAANGIDYTIIANNLENIGSYNWTVPTSDLITAKIKVSATDSVGNTSSVISTNPFTIDSTNPSVSFSLPAADSVVKGTTIKLTSAASDNLLDVTCQYKIGDGNYEDLVSCDNTDTNLTDADFTDGRNTFTVKAIDGVGNSTEQSVSFVIDTDNKLTVGSGADFTAIQEAIDKATANDTVSVAAGVYDESVTINKNLKIVGAGNPTATSFVLSGNATLLADSGGITAMTVNVSSGSKIQDGILLASTGGTVNVAGETYTEQVTITKSLNLIGMGNPTILAPNMRARSVIQGTTTHDYILAAYASSTTIDVRVEGFTIDAGSQNKTAGTTQIDGVFFRDVKNVGGEMAGLFSSTIHNFATPEYEGFGVVVYGDSLLTIDDNDISDYTRDGISINRYGGTGSNPNVTISKNIITGSATALNGINISSVTAGSVVDNTVTGNTRSLPWAGGGIVVWASTGMTISGNHVNGNFYGIDLQPIGTERTHHIIVSGNELTDNIKRGISLSGADNNTVKSNTISGPASGTDDVAIGLANTATGNMIGGSDLADGNIITMATSDTGGLLYAIYMQFDVGTGSNIIRYNTITGGQRAVQFDGAPGITGITTVADNTISGQAFGGILAYNNGSLVITDNTLTNTVRPLEFFGPRDLTITGNIINGSTYDGINLGNFSGEAKVEDNIIHDVVIDNNGISAQSSGGGLNISGNTIHDITGGGRGIQINSAATGVNIHDNEIYDVTGFAGIVIDTGATGAKINNNHIHNNVLGVAVNEQTVEFNNNRILNNRWGVDLNKAGATFVLFNNNISGNDTTPADSYGVKVTAGTVSAAQNWWGEITGPASDNNIGGTGDKVIGTMDFVPWCTNNTCSLVDEAAPIANFISSGLPANLTNQTSASIAVDGVDVLYYQSKLDDGSYNTASAINEPIDLSDLAAGSHTLSVIGRDQAGNWQSSPTTYTWTIDTESPSLSAVSIASNNPVNALAKVGDIITLSFTADENIQSPVVTIAAGQPVIVTQGINAQNWRAVYTMVGTEAEAAVVFNIGFTDLAGNPGTAVTAVVGNTSSVTFDKTAPAVSITSIGLNNFINNGERLAIAIAGTAETGSLVNVALRDSVGTVVSAEPPLQLSDTETEFLFFINGSDLQDGVITPSVTATDAAGNVSQPATTPTAIKDIIAPTVSSHTPLMNAVNVETNIITIVFSEAVNVETGQITLNPATTFTIGGSGTDTITLTTSPLNSNTVYTATVTTDVEDLAGNALAEAHPWSFTTATLYNIALNIGPSGAGAWNLISLPVVPNNKSIGVVLGAAEDKVEAVWTYDPNNTTAINGWLVYVPDNPLGTNNLDIMTAGFGYWISVTSNTTINGSGSLLTVGPTAPPSRDLRAGWNLIGYYQIPGEGFGTKASAFASLSGSYTSLWGFNNPTNNQGGGFKSSVDQILPGDAFWISLPSAKIYTPSNIIFD